MWDYGLLICSSLSVGGGGGGGVAVPPALRLTASLILPGFGAGLLVAEVAGERRDAATSVKLLVFLCLAALGQLGLMCFLEEITVIKLVVCCTVSRVGGSP